MGVRENEQPRPRVDEILALIDTGLQTAGDTAYGLDSPGTCWRCRTPGPDLCPACRDALLDETAVAAPPGELSGYAFGFRVHGEEWRWTRDMSMSQDEIVLRQAFTVPPSYIPIDWYPSQRIPAP